MCVGARDPHDSRSGKPGPILTFLNGLSENGSLRNRPPDHIYLLPTVGGMKPTLAKAHKTKSQMAAQAMLKNVPVSIKEMVLASPHIYNAALPVMRQAVLAIIASHQKNEPKYFINYSPGTPQMQALWVSFVTSGFIKAKLYQTIEPANPKSRAQVEQVVVNFVEEDLAKSKSRELFEQYLFAATMRELERLQGSIIDDRRQNAQMLHQLCQAYHYWDVLDYQQAQTVLAHTNFADSKLAAIVAGQLESLNHILTGAEETHLVDLYHRALRKRSQGDYPDMLANIATVCELLATSQVKHGLQKAFNVMVDEKLRARVLGSGAESWFKDIYTRDIPKYLSMGHALVIWQEMQLDTGTFGVTPLREAEILDTQLSEQRTRYLHKGLNVEQVGLEKIRMSTRTLLRDAYFRDFQTIDNYAFSAATLGSVAALFPKLLQ